MIQVDVALNNSGHLTVTYTEDKSLYIQNDYDVDYFLDGILPIDYNETYVGKKSAESKVKELIANIKEGWVTECLISAEYFPEEEEPTPKTGTKEQVLWKQRTQNKHELKLE